MPPPPLLPDLKRMRVQELRDALASRGLQTSGLKDTLVARLQASLIQESTPISPAISTKDTPSISSLASTTEAQTEHAARESLTDRLKKEDQALSADKETEKLGRSSNEKEETISAEANLSQEIEEGEYISPLNGPDEALEQSSKPVIQNSALLPAHAHGLGNNPFPGVSALARTSIQIGDLTDYERKRRRAERFGTDWQISESEKRIIRSQRFSSLAAKSRIGEGKKSEAEKRQDRAARFGVINEELKKQARLRRFGVKSEKKYLSSNVFLQSR